MKVKKDEWLQVRADEQQLKAIDKLVEYTGESRSQIFRDLFPFDVTNVEAMVEMQKLSKLPAIKIARVYRLSFDERAANILRAPYGEEKEPFRLQIAICRQKVGQKPDINDLFVARCRAEQNVRGYEIKKLQIKDSKDQPREEFIITGPGVFDTDESLILLARDMEKILREYAI
jgi:hypothetical protein